mmetsp:Transcript_31939/g.57265  ORF Transcript_31939/g.57265 Transcript_31939/m.57265 type:complete len:242 (-) Transcript_31939:546-1271(-)
MRNDVHVDDPGSFPHRSHHLLRKGDADPDDVRYQAERLGLLFALRCGHRTFPGYDGHPHEPCHRALKWSSYLRLHAVRDLAMAKSRHTLALRRPTSRSECRRATAERQSPLLLAAVLFHRDVLLLGAADGIDVCHHLLAMDVQSPGRPSSLLLCAADGYHEPDERPAHRLADVVCPLEAIGQQQLPHFQSLDSSGPEEKGCCSATGEVPQALLGSTHRLAGAEYARGLHAKIEGEIQAQAV